MGEHKNNQLKAHTQLFVRTVFADRLRKEGFTSYRGEDLFWYRLINNEVVHSVCIFTGDWGRPIMLDLGYSCHPLFVPPIYKNSPRVRPTPGYEQIYTAIPELIPGSMPYGQQPSTILGSMNNFGEVPNTLAMNPSYQKKVLPVLEKALGVLDDIKTPRDCYEIHKRWRADEIENEVWLTMTTYFADEVLYWEDYALYPYCKDFIHGKIAWLEAVDKDGKLRKADREELERLYLLEKAFQDGGREEYLETLCMREKATLKFLEKYVGIIPSR